MDLPLPEPLDPRAQRRIDRERFWRALTWSGGFVAVLWWIKLVEIGLNTSFRGLGVVPRDPLGLIGILSAPLLHGSIAHLLSNTLPLLFLGGLALATLPRATPRTVGLIWLFSGAAVWWFGRPPVHVGASGIAHGLLFFLLCAGLLRRDRAAIATALAAFFLYGGMLLTVLPRESEVSWEYHLGGALGGLIAACLWFRRDPLPARKRYSWEDETDSAELHPDAAVLEPPSPRQVPVLWVRTPRPSGGVVLPLRPRPQTIDAPEMTAPKQPDHPA